MSEFEETAKISKSAEMPCYLLPCPFCGGLPGESEFFKIHGHIWYKIYCKKCGISIEGGRIKEVVRKWNIRTAMWFDIEKYTPKLNTWCFVSDGMGTHFAAYIDKLGFIGVDGKALDEWVEYWMPLPAAPESRNVDAGSTLSHGVQQYQP